MLFRSYVLYTLNVIAEKFNLEANGATHVHLQNEKSKEQTRKEVWSENAYEYSEIPRH